MSFNRYQDDSIYLPVKLILLDWFVLSPDYDAAYSGVPSLCHPYLSLILLALKAVFAPFPIVFIFLTKSVNICNFFASCGI
jgi:hypothetical protein